MIEDWVLPELRRRKAKPRLLVRDSQRLIGAGEVALREFCEENQFVLLMAGTNLVFRQEYAWALEEGSGRKILLVDQSRHVAAGSGMHAPAPFYPDFLAELPRDARFEIDIRSYLQFRTGDSAWPALVNNRLYAAQIVRSLPEVLRAHANLRTADPTRFTDGDLQQIVACAALGIGGSAFRSLTPDDYFQIGLFGLDRLEELKGILPGATAPILDKLSTAPAPFRWFGQRPAEEVVRTFYLCLLLAQHSPNWQLLAGNIDRGMGAVTDIAESDVTEGAARLVELNPAAADRDLTRLEASLTADDLELFLVNEAKAGTPEGWTSLLERERYSTLVRSLALLLALDDRLSAAPHAAEHARIDRVLAEGPAPGATAFVETRVSSSWTALRDLYLLAGRIQPILLELSSGLRALRPSATFGDFWRLWNEKKINRLEYYLSRLERSLGSGDLLNGPADSLPPMFAAAAHRLRGRVSAWRDEADRNLKDLNLRFQDLVQNDYPSWIAADGDPRLTAQFLRRCLKPNWDPQTEKAVVFIFDGMRYDIWDEMLRPILEERMDILEDYPASSILPSETQLTRKAISAGDYPDRFNRNAAESDLLQAALAREFGLSVTVTTLNPDTAGVGETVRYRAGNLDVYIFELCDKELHHIAWRELPDGRQVPARPLSLIYEQQIKAVIDHEVQAIMRGLVPGTKVFITADHGFGLVGRTPIWFNDEDLEDPADVKYLNAMLHPTFSAVNLPPNVKQNLITFAPAALRMPAVEHVSPRNADPYDKSYGAIVFPRAGFSFSRPQSPHRPDAYSHGGISLPELLIPMVVLRVKGSRSQSLSLDLPAPPAEASEGEEVLFQVRVRRPSPSGSSELRVDVSASYRIGDAAVSLAPQILYLTASEQIVAFRFIPDTSAVTIEARRNETLSCNFSASAHYQEAGREMPKSVAAPFKLRLKPEVITRRVGNLGSILGLTPRSKKSSSL